MLSHERIALLLNRMQRPSADNFDYSPVTLDQRRNLHKEPNYFTRANPSLPLKQRTPIMSPEPSRKRTRQACEPCRRKKTKCTGERPICNYCERLGQQCMYADEEHDGPYGSHALPAQQSQGSDSSRQWENRLQLLEAKLSEVVEYQHRQLGSVSPTRVSSRVGTASIEPEVKGSNSILPSWDKVTAIAHLYLVYCDSQPLPIFHRDTFIQTIRSRDPELLFAMMALAARFCPDPFAPECSPEACKQYYETSRSITLQRVADGPIEISTIQSLCLLSLVDFTEGNVHRASINSSVAMSLAHCAGLTSESSAVLNDIAREERRRCFWSIFLLKRLHGADFSTLDFSKDENFPWYPSSSDTTIVNHSSGRIPRPHPPFTPLSVADHKEPARDLGIIAYSVQLSEVWFKTTRYARRRGKPATYPPWSPQSDYSMILSQQMEFETRMPYIHRFKPANFSSRSPEELQQNRAYWSPWLFIQFLYHTNLCLLNHPLILSLRLRECRCVIPEVFLQHTYDLISSHAAWITHYIDILEEKQFEVSDPFLSHCVAIVATIHLQESFQDDPELRREHQMKFAKCLKFIRGFERKWPHVARLVEKLQRLEATVIQSYPTTDNSQTPNRGMLIDLGLFWEVLEYSSVSEVPNRRLFGHSLYTGNRPPTMEVSETPSLPEPTRIETYSTSARTPHASNSNGPGSRVMTATSETRFQNSSNLSPETTFGDESRAFYNEDELAVLAESLFQRPEFSRPSDTGWSIGNL